MIAGTSDERGVRVMCNGCGALAPPVPGRSWRKARDAARGWATGRQLDTDDACPACALAPATLPLARVEIL